MKIVGAVARLPGHASALARQIAADSARGAAREVDTLFVSEHVALLLLRRPEESLDDVIAGQAADGGDRYWFASESCRPRDLADARVSDVGQAIAQLRASLEGGYLGVRLCRDGAVELYTDRWGLSWTFVRRLRDAVVFGSHFGALCRTEPSSLTVDRDAALLELSIGYVPDTGTVFREVLAAPAHAIIRLGPQRVDITDRKVFEYGDALQRASSDAKFRRLDELFEAMTDGAIAVVGTPVTATFMAGSRLAVAWLARKGAVGPLLTFGEAESEVVGRMRALAGRGGWVAHWSRFPVEGGDGESWRSMIQALGNAGVVQWCGWADDWSRFVRARSTHCVMPFLGEVVSGKFVAGLPEPLSPDDGQRRLDPWAERWLAFALASGEWTDSGLLRVAARRRAIAAAREQLATIEEGARYAQPHQRAYHCDLLSRQRRWVGAQTELISAYVKPVAFFAHRGYREFWSNVGLDDLRRQALLHAYAEARFPTLFPKAPGAVMRATRRVANKVRRGVVEWWAGVPPPRRPPPVIHAKLLAGHYEAILAQLDRNAQVLDDMVDVSEVRSRVAARAAGTVDGGLSTLMLIRLVNVMHLLELRDARATASVIG